MNVKNRNHSQAGKNSQLKRERERSLPDRTPLLLLLFLVTLFIYLHSFPPACAETLEKKQASYPDSPIEVIEAFIETGLRETSTAEEMSLCDEFLRPQYKYLPDEKDRKSNLKTRVLVLGEPWGPCMKRYHIVTGFEIMEVKQAKNIAIIKVKYKRLGWIWNTPKNIKECLAFAISNSKDQEMRKSASLNAEKKIEDNKNGWVWDKDGCGFLYITNDYHEVIYHLAKPGQLWRITDCYEPHISINSAIKVLKCEITERPIVSTTYPSVAQKIEIKKDIETLKKYLTK